MNTSNKRTGIVFLVIGGLFLGLGLWICSATFDYKGTAETVAVITNITSHSQRGANGKRSTTHDVYVRYEVDGQQYESELNTYFSSYHVGKQIDIYYRVADPSDIGTKSGDYMFLMFPAFGLLAIIVGVFCMLPGKKSKLLKTGTRINASYVETICETKFKKNGVSPYRIICEWTNPEDYIKYTFKSEYIWMNPEEIIQRKGITTFPVYLDSKNIKKYAVDVCEITDGVVDLR